MQFGLVISTCGVRGGEWGFPQISMVRENTEEETQRNTPKDLSRTSTDCLKGKKNERSADKSTATDYERWQYLRKTLASAGGILSTN